MSGNVRELEEAEAVPDVLVPRHCQGKDRTLSFVFRTAFGLHIFSNTFHQLSLFRFHARGAQVKKKMLYSSSFDALKKSLVGVQKYIQATDLSEASREAVEEKLRATDRQ